MGGPRDEIARRGESDLFRAADYRRKKIGIPSGDQYDGIPPAHGSGVAGRRHWRYCAGNSTHPESKTADRSARRLEFAQTRDSSPPRPPQTRKLARLQES